jgi:hypothetical protein
MRPLPPANGPPIDAKAVGHDVHRHITLQQLDGAYPSPLEFGGAALWAHEHLYRA